MWLLCCLSLSLVHFEVITTKIILRKYSQFIEIYWDKNFIFCFHFITSIAEPNNWSIIPDPLLINFEQGVGGFAPFKYFGILKGIAVCVFLFIGFDVVGTGTKWKSLYGILSFIFGTAALFAIGTVVTLAQPFYLLVSWVHLLSYDMAPSWIEVGSFWNHLQPRWN